MINFFKNIIFKDLISSKEGIRDVLISILPQIASAASGFIISIFLARGLGAEILGKYVLIMSFTTVISGLSDLGINQTAIRFASRSVSAGKGDSQMSYLRWTFRLKLSLVLLLLIIAYFFAPSVAINFWKVENLTSLIRLNLLLVLFAVFSTIPNIYFQSLKKFGKNAVVAISQSLINVAGILFLAYYNLWSLEYVVIVSLISNFTGAIIFLFLVPKGVIWKLSDFKNQSASIFRKLYKSPADDIQSEHTPGTFAFYMVLASVIVMFTMQADVWLMGYFLQKDQVGIYNVATKLAQPLIMFLTAFNTAIWPRASSIVSTDDTISFLKKTLKISLLVFIVAFIYSVGVPYLIPLIYGKAFSASVLIGQLLCLRYSISILVSPVGIIGYNLGLVRIYWINNLVQLVVVVLINIFLLPVIGPVASAIALIGNEVTGLVLSAYVIKRKIGKIRKMQNGEAKI